ncbi:tyrosine-type recombinase/integrase [Cupriavidus sp. DF5525]|uniref:tyrosine-type recombinase/integrase n=1 Tax=Cupriavidus sp. DF5525 TaxID=3160989 RepID=UPI00345FBCDA
MSSCLSRDGIAYILRRHVQAAAQQLPALAHKRVTPHVLRHSCAVGLLQSGNALPVIRDYLGHASMRQPDATSRQTFR